MTKDITAEHVLNDLRYLTLLARSFPTVADASTEIINLEAILNLPKGTEHFLSDIHGEHQAFNHVLKKCLRCDQAQSERDIQQHAARL